MRQAIKKAMWLLLLLGIVPVESAPIQSPLESIEIHYRPSTYKAETIKPLSLEINVRRQETEDIDFILLHQKPGSPKIRILQKSESSIVLYDENYVFPLLDWKHGYSPDSELEEISPGKFHAHDHADAPFPSSTINELEAGIRIQAEKSRYYKGRNLYPSHDEFEKYVETAILKSKQCEPISKCAVGSRKIFNIQIKNGDDWQTIHVLSFKNALSC
jgi:hypothetical protein